MDDKKDWKRFKKLKFDSKSLSRRAKKAETATTKHAHKFVLKKLSNLRAVRQYISLWFLLIAALIGALILQILWFQGSYLTRVATNGGTYAEAIESELTTLNPLYAKTEAEESARHLLFSGLLGRDAAGGTRYDLASSYTIDQSGKVYTVVLRPNLKWSDGANLTAQDVVFTVNTMKNPASRSVMGTSWQGVAVRALDDSKVEFSLPAPYAAFTDALSFSVLPKHILGSVEPSMIRESQFGVNPVGSGPFSLRLLQKVSGESARKTVYMTANEHYFRAPIKLDRFELHVYSSSEAVLRAVKTHDVNAMIDTRHTIKAESLPADFVQKVVPINNATYAFFNMDSPLLSEVKIRQALWAATDVNGLRRSVDEMAHPMPLPLLASQIPLEDAASLVPKYDVAASEKILDELGWKKGAKGVRTKDGATLTLRVVANKTAGYRPLLNMLEQQWKDLGVDVKVQEFAQQAGGQGFVQSVLQPRGYDVLINEIAIGADPDVFAYWHSSQASSQRLNFSNYRNKTIDDILISARQRSDINLRNEKYKAFVRQWTADAPAIPLFQPVIHYAHTKRTTSFPESVSLPTASGRYGNIDYWTAERGTVYKTP